MPRKILALREFGIVGRSVAAANVAKRRRIKNSMAVMRDWGSHPEKNKVE